jgi:parvulin-like peptidyl-prolyl isomerase
MRRSWLLSGSLVFMLTGCGGDAFTAHPDVAAKAADQELSAQRVAEILNDVKGVNLNPEAAKFIATLWVDYTLFAQGIADGSLASDSAMIRDAMWVEVSEIQAGHWFDTLMVRMGTVTPAMVDSAYAAGNEINLQHILLTVAPDATEPQRVAARRKIDGLLAQARGGASFTDLVKAHSQDPGSASEGGFYGPAPRGAFATAFDSAAWQLKPGEISDVVVTEFGFHVIRRLDDTEAKARFAEAMPAQLGTLVERNYLIGLDSNSKISIKANAVPNARAAMADLNSARRDKTKLATFDGGALTVAEFARWIRASTQDPMRGPEMLAQMQSVPDSMLELGIRQVVIKSLMLRDAEKEKIDLTPEEWNELRTQFLASVDTLKSVIGLGPEVVDPAANEADRRRAAALKVDEFFTRMTKGEAQIHLLPGMLSWTLRQDAEFGINTIGLQHAVEVGKEMQAARVDAGGSAVDGRAPIAPAPGPAPVPGGTAPTGNQP